MNREYQVVPIVLFLNKPKSRLLSRGTVNASNGFLFPADILVFPVLPNVTAS